MFSITMKLLIIKYNVRILSVPDRQGIGSPSFMILTGSKNVSSPFFNDIKSLIYIYIHF